MDIDTHRWKASRPKAVSSSVFIGVHLWFQFFRTREARKPDYGTATMNSRWNGSSVVPSARRG